MEMIRARVTARPRSTEIRSVEQAIQRWLDVCEHEGRERRDPVSQATLGVCKGCAVIMRAYVWETPLHELEAADLVAFRSWLLTEHTRDQAVGGNDLQAGEHAGRQRQKQRCEFDRTDRHQYTSIAGSPCYRGRVY
jgi:hypothetical protein